MCAWIQVTIHLGIPARIGDSQQEPKFQSILESQWEPSCADASQSLAKPSLSGEMPRNSWIDITMEVAKNHLTLVQRNIDR